MRIPKDAFNISTIAREGDDETVIREPAMPKEWVRSDEYYDLEEMI